MTNPSATQDSYPYQNEPVWSRSEKAIARRAFDAALGQELHEVIQEAKRMANEIQQPSDLWDLEHYQTQRRKEIDRKYDFRGSRLIDALGRLLYVEKDVPLKRREGRVFRVSATGFFRGVCEPHRFCAIR
jgi:hypothetical protein